VDLFQLLDPAARQKVLEGRAAHLQKTADHLTTIQKHCSPDPYGRETTHFIYKQVRAELN
jgi:hypothetical protein